MSIPLTLRARRGARGMRLVIGTALAIFFAAYPANAQDASSICSEKVRQFIVEIDDVLTRNPISVFVVQAVVDKYLPVRGCEVEAVLNEAKRSKFFYEIYDQYAEYAVVLENSTFIVSFALRKDTGNIEVPGARVKMHKRPEQKNKAQL